MKLGDCRNESLIGEIFGSVSEFARLVEQNEDNFVHGSVTVLYDATADIHFFYQRNTTQCSPSKSRKNYGCVQTTSPKYINGKLSSGLCGD